MGLPLFDDEIFYHMFRTNTLRATAVVVEPNLIKKASVVFAIAQDKTGTVIVNEGKLRSIKTFCIEEESMSITVESDGYNKNAGRVSRKRAYKMFLM